MDRQDMIKIQELLAALGHNPGPIDGRWGQKTSGALTNAHIELVVKPAPAAQTPQPPVGTNRVWDSVSLKNLEGVHPDLVKVFNTALPLLPFNVRVTEGPRTRERQLKLVKQGVSWTMNSRHIKGADGYAKAIDIVPYFDYDKDGDIDGEDLYAWPAYYQMAPIIKAAADYVGVPIEWGGDWKKTPDGPHWQLPVSRYP